MFSYKLRDGLRQAQRWSVMKCWQYTFKIEVQSYRGQVSSLGGKWSWFPAGGVERRELTSNAKKTLKGDRCLPKIK